MVNKINESEYKGLDKAGVSLIDFSAAWCNPCRMVAPIVEELSAEFSGRVRFYNVDVDENPALAEQFSVQSIPALALIKDGTCVDMSVGFLPKPALKAFIEKNL